MHTCLYVLVEIWTLNMYLLIYRVIISSLFMLDHLHLKCNSVFWPTNLQDPSGAWAADPNQWANAYYGYGYDPYGYAAGQDPSLYAYGAYAGYGQYPQQVAIHATGLRIFFRATGLRILFYCPLLFSSRKRQLFGFQVIFLTLVNLYICYPLILMSSYKYLVAS